MKLCTNCKHHQEGECIAPRNMQAPDLVDGQVKPRWIFCSTHRSTVLFFSLLAGTCGKRGRWFEAAAKGEQQ